MSYIEVELSAEEVDKVLANVRRRMAEDKEQEDREIEEFNARMEKRSWWKKLFGTPIYVKDYETFLSLREVEDALLAYKKVGTGALFVETENVLFLTVLEEQ